MGTRFSILCSSAAGMSRLGTADPTERRLYRKEIMRTGNYRHPSRGWSMAVTPARMDKWVRAFRAMADNGVRVEVTVDHGRKAEDVVGYMVDLFRDGDSLIGVHELTGERAFALADVVQTVSVEIDDLVDGEGRSYGEAVVRSSIVQTPVVPGQRGFEPIAASAATEGAPVQLSEVPKMEALIALIAKITGRQDVTEANAAAVLEEWFAAKEAESADAPEMAASAAPGSGADTAPASPAANPAGGTGSPSAAAPDAAKGPSDRETALMRQLVQTKLDTLVKLGKLPGKVAKEIAEQILSTIGSNPTLASMVDAKGNPVLFSMIDHLETAAAFSGAPVGRATRPADGRPAADSNPSADPDRERRLKAVATARR